MILWRLTLTGLDDTVPFREVVDLFDRDPRIELGILFSDTRAGAEGRYPDHRWIEVFTEELSTVTPPRLALHVCGGARKRLLAAGALEGFSALRHFDRVQLNGVFDAGDTLTLARLLASPARSPAIITQHDANPSFAQALASPRHQILFDASGGHGIVRSTWPPVLREKRCGYAGGLGPENLAQELTRIAAAAGSHSVWIDMESSLRDARDHFSLEAAHRVVDLVHAWEQSCDTAKVPHRA